MPKTLVALDLETTGLEAERDAILEIGAIKFKGERMEGEFQTLVNPGRPIPQFITQLTGITDAMVANAPRLTTVLPQLEEFVGEAPVIGHNVKFDLAFLNAKRALRYNDALDTLDLGAVLLPTAPRYNLGAMGKELGIVLPATHRALDDCKVTVAVYRALFQKALELPLEVLAEIVQVGENVGWGAGLIFEEALRERSKEKVQARKVHSGVSGPLFKEGAKAEHALQPKDEIKPLDIDELAALLEHAGPFSKHFPNYEFRAEQVQMLRAVAHAFSDGRHLLVEAGTGTGKCLTGDTWIICKSGSRMQIGEVWHSLKLPNEPILCIAPSGKLTYQKIRAIHSNGVRQVWRVRTALGRTITATANHPFLTFEGWQHLSALRVGERIATIRRLPAGTAHFPAHEAFVVGAMLGDGGCVHLDSPNFTNFDPDVVAAVRRGVAQLGNVRLVDTKAQGHYGFQRLSLMGHERSGLSILLEKLDIAGRDAHNKHIPEPYFQADEKTVCRLLAGLWVTDGSIEKRDGHPAIASASEQLISDIQHLLLKLNIIARVRYKPARLNGKRFHAWILTISDLESKRAFWRTVGKHLVGAKKQRLEAWWQIHRKQLFNPNDDLIPISAWKLIDRERQRAGQSWYAIRQECIVSSDRRREISRAKMKSMGEFLGSSKLVDFAQSDQYWDRIVSIEFAGEAATYDLTMEGEPSFVANDIVVHNSVAYLIPAAYWALQNGQRVVISTNTINLQDQLINKDIPDLQAALGLNFRASVLKGRSHYLCPRRLDNMRRHGPKSAEEMRVLAKVLVWLSESGENGGERGELSLSGPADRAAWLRLSAEDEGCTTDMCQNTMGGRCPFYRAHRAAQAAHVIIVNHALLLADIAAENRVLPEYQHLIVDEAHHLEAATTDGLSFELNRLDLERRLKDVGGPRSGLLGGILTNTRAALPPDLQARLEHEADVTYDHATTALELAGTFFEGVAGFLEEQREGGRVGEYTQQVRILPATRTLPHWERVEIGWDDLRQVLTPLAEALARLGQGLAELDDYEIEERDDLISAANAAARHFEGIVENVNGLVAKPDPKMIYWAQVHPDGERVSLHAAPLHVGPLVEKYLWHAKEAVVMTSATLTTAGEFDYLKGRLNANEADELSVGSPFDYETSTLLYLVSDIPEPVEKAAYQKAVEQGLVSLCKATHGRALVLFTSYAQLKQTAQAIRDPLAREGVDVYDQAEGISRATLLDSFKTSEGGVLLGTRSFWEGVDVPGEALSALVIVKLPFDVPSDPIIAARAETFEDPFNQYTVPEAVLKFRQGFGRLIRARSDRGVVAVFDRRVQTKRYGEVFIHSLPACTVRRGPMALLAREAARWIDGH